jgi:hypothetical protein
VKKVSQYPEVQYLLIQIQEAARAAIQAGILPEEVLAALRRATEEADAEFRSRQN